LHPSLRGAISGLGTLDIFAAASMLRRPTINNPTNQPASTQIDSA
jgi:hypothetical protein